MRGSGTVIRLLESLAWSAAGTTGPLIGPGLITSSERYIPVPDTEPGEIAEIAEIEAILKTPGYDCASIAYFKMVDADGFLCFPDEHQLGLDVLILTERNTAGMQD